MLSIERRFQKTKDDHFFWSSFICFSTAIYGMGYPIKMIHKEFKRLVDKSDYLVSELPDIFRFLDKVSVRIKKSRKSQI